MRLYWTPAAGARVRLRPGLGEKNGLRAGELATVVYDYGDGDLQLKREDGGEALAGYFARADLAPAPAERTRHFAHNVPRRVAPLPDSLSPADDSNAKPNLISAADPAEPPPTRAPAPHVAASPPLSAPLGSSAPPSSFGVGDEIMVNYRQAVILLPPRHGE